MLNLSDKSPIAENDCFADALHRMGTRRKIWGTLIENNDDISLEPIHEFFVVFLQLP